MEKFWELQKLNQIHTKIKYAPALMQQIKLEPKVSFKYCKIYFFTPKIKQPL